MRKKGSLNMSIEVIIVVVIAFVVLGLGLGFVRNQMKLTSETATGVQEQIKQQILEDLRTGDKKLSFPATTLTIEKGNAQDIAIGVKNTKNNDLNFNIEIKSVKSQNNPEMSSEDLAQQVTFFYGSGPFTLKTTDAEAYNIKINGKGNKDTYLVNLKIVDTENPSIPYAEKSFFVNII
jgi:hypothetical protein